MKKIAVIGGGIVGVTSSFYLAKKGHSVHLYDDGLGQATKAAAGIISPWLSQRRNKIWYRLTANGAEFYNTLLADIQTLHLSTHFYRQNGTYVFKKSDKLLDKITHLAHQRRAVDKQIGELKQVSISELKQAIPDINAPSPALFASGGAVIDGREFIHTLKQAARQYHAQMYQEKIILSNIIPHYDAVILAVGAWLPELLNPLGYRVDIRPQKGQLFAATLSNKQTSHYPVFMPQSEIDLLPFDNGQWVIGATHENNMGYDLTPDKTILQSMKQEATQWLPELAHSDMEDIRVGTRAYTSDFTPFFGQVPELPDVYTASGLGASGLTSGPYIGYLLSRMVDKETIDDIDISLYSPNRYIKTTHD